MNFENLSKIGFHLKLLIKKRRDKSSDKSSFFEIIIKKRRDKSRLYIFDITYLHIPSILTANFKQRIGYLS
jgi:hypothetical protein